MMMMMIQLQRRMNRSCVYKSQDDASNSTWHEVQQSDAAIIIIAAIHARNPWRIITLLV